MKKKTIPWTQFMDMHSGGRQKLDWSHIYIEAPEEEAKTIFYNRFARNPSRVTCTCCGGDYSISESENLLQATGYERGCDYKYIRLKDGKECEDSEGWTIGRGDNKGYKGQYVEHGESKPWKKYETLDVFKKRKDIKIIYAKDIKKSERTVEVPEEGCVWN